MAQIHVLDSATIDKIAAGEVVERPVSVVKELVENAIDAGAAHITVEIKEGGISMIRVTDDGSGIEKSELGKVFYRHATSKIETAEDLNAIETLGFRGEALSSVSAVARVELVTKTADELTGSRLVIEGGKMQEPEEIGAPTGTTLLVRDLFYNTPARRKFLKTPATEGSYINEYMQHLALAAPRVAFQFVMNGQTRFFTSGNGEIKEIIYRIYGKEVSSHLLAYEASMDGVKIRGFLGRPILARANRAFETLFVNGRYIKSALLSSAIEEGYRTLLMQHKYPFVVLHFAIDPTRLDVNVHPTKLDIRISDPGELLKLITDTVSATLTERSLIQPSPSEKTAEMKKEEAKKEKEHQRALTRELPQPFEENRVAEQSGYGADKAKIAYAKHAAIQNAAIQSATIQNAATQNTAIQNADADQSGFQNDKAEKPVASGTATKPQQEKVEEEDFFSESEGVLLESLPAEKIKAEDTASRKIIGKPQVKAPRPEPVPIIKQKDLVIVEKPQQLELFEEVEIRGQELENFTILGQVFDTYWILTMGDKLYYVDQHAAHEKVMYEKLMKHYREKEVFAEPLNPPIILTLQPREAQVYLENKEAFTALGFEVEPFGEDAYALRSVPMDLYGSSEKELFLSALDAVVEGGAKRDADAILFKIASMSCKAAVKGNSRLSLEEARALFKEMFACENPYHCPHGRPTMISVSKQEMEKKFHR